jgi:hypothetical protein
MLMWAVAMGVLGASAHATTTPADIQPGVDPSDPAVVLEGEQSQPGSSESGEPGTILAGSGQPRQEYQWLLSCSVNYPGAPMADCAAAHSCAVETQSRWVLWARDLPDGDWFQQAFECYEERPAVPNEAEQPMVTPAMVEEAVRRMGLPALPLQVQPADATLVNFDTIFFAQPEPFDRSVSLVGFDVRVLAEPVAYGWSFGDGTAATTSAPGAPYPAKDVVHRYTDAHVTVQPSVDVTYEVRYSVNGGQMQTLDTTLTAEGPPTGLRIREATPLLAGAG